MCDEDTVSDSAMALNRRRFNTLTAAGVLAAMLPVAGDAAEVTGKMVDLSTPDGNADCYFVHPAVGRHPGVLIWPDILGLRPAFRAMANRLAASGYAVLLVNPYYRMAPAPVVEEGASFQDSITRERVLPLAKSLTPGSHVSDAKAFIAWLDQQAAVDTGRRIGTMGYCMGGPIVFRTAAAVPGRVGAAATFHGGGLVGDGPDSPHLLIPQTTAQFLVAIAENDDQRDPEAKNVLRDAFDAHGRLAEIEVFAGTLHGWCPPDSRVYDEVSAERAWGRLLALFAAALAAKSA